jgi:hypothetical protein
VASAASAASRESLVTVRSTAVGGHAAPVTVTVHTSRTAEVRVTVNGHLVRDAFGRAGTTRRVAHLARRNGLRAGKNRLVITATTEAGRRDVDVRTVRLRATRLLADAGRDRTMVVGRAARIGQSAPTGARGVAPKRYRWRVVRAPKGARTALRGATRARPSFSPKKRGTYTLRLTTTARSGAVAHDSLQLYALPDDPPTGVRIQTLAGGSGPQIVVDGRGLPDVSDPNGIHIAVLERRTRAVVEVGTAPDTGVIRRIATNWAAKGDYLVVVSGTRGIVQSGLDDLDGFLAAVGGTKLSASDRAHLADGSPFTLMGDTNAPAGSAWVNIPTKRDGVPFARTLAAANLSGSLVRGDVSDRYDYVENDVPHFRTHLGSEVANENRMIIDGKPHQQQLPGGAQDGFHVIALDPQSLDLVYEAALPTGGSDVAARGGAARNLAAGLKTAAAERGPTIVLVQSIGHPLAATPDWTQASAWIDKLGGDARQFNALDGTKGYALVGSLDNPQTAVQASTVAGTGDQLFGTFGRSRTHGFEPMLADSTGATDTGLTDIVNQPAQGFPAFDTPGLQAAETWFATKLRICDGACDIRRQYWEQYRADWDTRSTKLLSLQDKFPSDQSAFTKQDFDTVWNRLQTEIGDLLDSRTYFDQLTKPFGLADSQALIDVQSLSKDLYDSIQPPAADNTKSYWLTFTSKIVAVAAGVLTVVPPVGAALSGLAAGFALMGYLTQQNGAPVGGEILARGDKFQQQVLDRLRAAQNAIQFSAVQVASDWGKLQAVEANIVSRKWRIAATDGRTLSLLRQSLKQWMAESLVPLVYSRAVAASGMTTFPPDSAPTDDINYLTCHGSRVFRDVPRSAQLSAVTGFQADGTPKRETFMVTHARGGALPPSLSHQLFDSPDAATPGIGLDRYAFINPRLFDVEHVDPQHCGVG